MFDVRNLVLTLATTAALIFGSCYSIVAATLTFTDRATFLHSVGATITDGYDQPIYGYSSDTPILLTDAQMSAALNETRYRSTTAKDQNLVGPVYGNNPGAYCAGCNGSFVLDFTSTSIGNARGVFGFAMTLDSTAVAGDVFRFRNTRGSVEGELTVGGDEMTGQVGWPMAGHRPISLRRVDPSSSPGSPPR
jgi:hypothetical protein